MRYHRVCIHLNVFQPSSKSLGEYQIQMEHSSILYRESDCVNSNLPGFLNMYLTIVGYQNPLYYSQLIFQHQKESSILLEYFGHRMYEIEKSRNHTTQGTILP